MRTAFTFAIVLVTAQCGRASPEPARPDVAVAEGQPAAGSVATKPRSGGSEDDPSVRIRRAKTLGEALAIARPQMQDTTDSASRGSFLLLLWAIQAMKWTDVNVAVNETSHAALLRDSSGQRGRRLCVEGTIRGTGTDRFQFGEAQTGMMLTQEMEAYRFAAVGAPAKPGEKAHFCGVATGIVDYQNIKQEKVRAVYLVGMFAPPEKHGGDKDVQR